MKLGFHSTFLKINQQIKIKSKILFAGLHHSIRLIRTILMVPLARKFNFNAPPKHENMKDCC